MLKVLYYKQMETNIYFLLNMMIHVSFYREAKAMAEDEQQSQPNSRGPKSSTGEQHVSFKKQSFVVVLCRYVAGSC